MAPILAPSRKRGRADLPVAATVRVDLDQVCFRHGGRHVLTWGEPVSASGTFNVLLGLSGSGKSTIAQLIAGLLAPESGSVTINGKSIATLSDEERTRCMGFAAQDVFLFSGTVRDNLVLARPQASEAEICRAVRVAQAQALIEGLPAGYDTPLNELGTRLSGGERQRLAVARALRRRGGSGARRIRGVRRQPDATRVLSGAARGVPRENTACRCTQAAWNRASRPDTSA
ncbi:ATP-binding cassette domain-containing protein [Pseudomonas aeruginosa]|nr:ATP-binding cassette domain-containing protein [Pseudomonas aeruginosa]